jgi:hypothetical protein
MGGYYTKNRRLFAIYRIHVEMVKYAHGDGEANKDLTKDLQGTTP